MDYFHPTPSGVAVLLKGSTLNKMFIYKKTLIHAENTTKTMTSKKTTAVEFFFLQTHKIIIPTNKKKHNCYYNKNDIR